MNSAIKSINHALIFGLVMGVASLSLNATELTGKPIPVGSAKFEPAKIEPAAAGLAPTAAQVSSAVASAATATSRAVSSAAAQAKASMSAASEAAVSDIYTPAPAPVPAEPPLPPQVDEANGEGEWHKHMEQAFDHNSVDNHIFNAAVIVPVMGMLFGIGGPIFLILFLARMHYADKVRRQENINANIDKLLASGRDIPTQLLLESDARDYASMSYLNRGLRIFGIGLGLFIFLTILCGIDVGAVAFLFIGYGLSQVVVWFLARRDQGVEQG